MRIVLDTNTYTDFMRREPTAVRVVTGASRIFLPLFVLAELRAGFVRGDRTHGNLAGLAMFLSLSHVEVLLPDENTADVYAVLNAHLRRTGRPIPVNDLWIAALVVQHGLVLFSRDAHFDRLPQVSRWKSDEDEGRDDARA